MLFPFLGINMTFFFLYRDVNVNMFLPLRGSNVQTDCVYLFLFVLGGRGSGLHGAVWKLHGFGMRAGMLVFLCGLSWVGVVYFGSIPSLSWELQAAAKERPPCIKSHSL